LKKGGFDWQEEEGQRGHRKLVTTGKNEKRTNAKHSAGTSPRPKVH